MRQRTATTVFIYVSTFVLAAGPAVAIAHPDEELKQVQPPAATSVPSQPIAPQSVMSSWHFQAVYGIGYADFEIPVWKADADPAVEDQISSTGLLTQARYTHAIEHPLNQKQMVRWGLSLINGQTTTGSGVLASLAQDSKVPSWRSWGVGADLFLVRRFSPACDFDAGLQLDYHLSGNSSMRNFEQVGSVNSSPARLEQQGGWRVAFSGGISGLYLGPIGLVARLSGFVTQASFTGHSRPIRAQGIQFQAGANLALGRGDQ